MESELFQECSRSPPVHWLCTVFLLIINLHPSIQQAHCRSPSILLNKTVFVGRSVALSLGNRQCRVYTCMDEGKFGFNLEDIDYDCNSVPFPEDRCDNFSNPDVPLYSCCGYCGDFRFLQEPEPYYYVTYGSDITITCKIRDILLGNHALRSSTFFRNGISIMPSSFKHYVLQRDAESDHIVGLTITSASQEDNNVVVHCALQSGELIALRSRNTTIYVGDGTPLAPPQPPLFPSVTVGYATVEWVVAITVAHAPILSYIIFYWSSVQSRGDAVFVETPSNATTFTIMPTPGFSYFVEVRGRNSVGVGAISARGTVSIPLGEVPPAPQNLTVNYVIVENTDDEAPALNIERMSPIREYRIFFTDEPLGTGSAETGLVAIVKGDTTTHKLFTHEERTFYVGVAAVNAAGQSNIASTDIAIIFERAVRETQPSRPATLVAQMPSKGAPAVLVTQMPSKGAPVAEKSAQMPPFFPINVFPIIVNVGVEIVAICSVGIFIAGIFLVVKCAKIDFKGENDSEDSTGSTIQTNSSNSSYSSVNSSSIQSSTDSNNQNSESTKGHEHDSAINLGRVSSQVLDENEEETLSEHSDLL